ncbi:MAG: bifunctional [glutamate--ammonia ligase]-adenylyl-L-tyrosine phosphorylase/[glutamate--ammonia-ligase] adenylyltransferase [Gammaproteobacteria bacterium]|nr:bifunctional [glutamate--ammonia ligase]-adenylyl-L-tyrosine phosphorylase/[glutamate--ammonia-ligase] adenylyltransferase [Gammaproteobacteria bacterium]
MELDLPAYADSPEKSLNMLAGIGKLQPQLADEVQARWQALCDAHPGLAEKLQASPGVAESLPRVWASSEFVSDICVRNPLMFEQLLDSNALEAGPPVEEWRPGARLEEDEAAMMAALRRYRQRAMLQIAWRDIAGWADLDETLAALSSLADNCIQTALAFSARQLSGRHGWPGTDENGEPAEMIVMAMGKLGARELNFSSDIDLVFLYPCAGQSDGAKPLDHETWFNRQARLLIRLLDERTADGFVFRVDARLRPFGNAGPLTMSLPAFEAYLQGHGRDWERYAWIKARALSGSKKQQDEVAAILRPFVYRRYLDYGVFESLRTMKEKVSRMSREKARQHDIKLGPGGIREIEFVVQCFQLLRGGNDGALREPRLMSALARLAERNDIDPETAASLCEHYRFLRRLENRIQAMHDQQVHELPGDDLSRQRMALAMGFGDWPALAEEVANRTGAAEKVFQELVFGPAGESERVTPALAMIWEQSISTEQRLLALEKAGFSCAEEVLAMLETLRGSALYQRLDRDGRRRLDRLMPMLLQATADQSPEPAVFRRVLDIVEAVGRRSAYFALLNENAGARVRLVSLCSQSRQLAEEIAAHPVLLDELIDPRVFETPPTRADLVNELERRFTGVDDDDLEGQMEALRRFQRASVFRVALADLNKVLPLMKISDRLTELAEIVLQRVLELGQMQLATKHGLPRCGNNKDMAGFAIIGYGKLGGLELGYGSDLDIVFVYQDDEAGETDGSQPLDNSVYFTRLAQRIVHMLSTQTRAGRLYEVDTQLRPSGKSGLLVSGISAFASYQKAEAWTWEHQALLRARCVAGSAALAGQFERIRREVLTKPRQRQSLAAEIGGMRERMRGELDQSTEQHFDLKQGRGGITDIEFLVQYLVLLHASEYPALLAWSDNIRQLESLAEAHVVTPRTAEYLAEAYRVFRGRLHRLALSAEGKVVDASEFENERCFVSELWDKELGGG